MDVWEDGGLCGCRQGSDGRRGHTSRTQLYAVGLQRALKQLRARRAFLGRPRLGSAGLGSRGLALYMQSFPYVRLRASVDLKDRLEQKVSRNPHGSRSFLAAFWSESESGPGQGECKSLGTWPVGRTYQYVAKGNKCYISHPSSTKNERKPDTYP